jgi:carbonic anhydrase
LKKEILLEELVKGGLSGFYEKSFYWYIGSTTTPPCDEGI